MSAEKLPHVSLTSLMHKLTRLLRARLKMMLPIMLPPISLQPEQDFHVALHPSSFSSEKSTIEYSRHHLTRASVHMSVCLILFTSIHAVTRLHRSPEPFQPSWSSVSYIWAPLAAEIAIALIGRFSFMVPQTTLFPFLYCTNNRGHFSLYLC